MIHEELARLWGWEERHRRLVARLVLLLAVSIILDAIGSVVVYLLERHAKGTEVTTFGDAAFFCTVQLLTVSSQIRNPLTPWGRVVDVVLELWAVTAVAGSAGAIASFFQTADP